MFPNSSTFLYMSILHLYAKALKTSEHLCLPTLNPTFLMSKNLGLGPLIPDKLSERGALTEFRHYGNGNSNSQ